MNVHVVPTVVVEECTSLDAFEGESGLHRHVAGRLVGQRVIDRQSMKAKVLERPARQFAGYPRRDPVVSRIWQDPVGDLPVAELKVH